MVECESRRLTKYIYTGHVLIDTWWNVNVIMQGQLLVKLPGFNRYMVECEFIQHDHIFRVVRVLIDTWRNVNVKECERSRVRHTVLIDTWWNVNSKEMTR